MEMSGIESNRNRNRNVRNRIEIESIRNFCNRKVQANIRMFRITTQKSLEKIEILENLKKSLEKSLEIPPKKPKSFRRLLKTLTNLFQHSISSRMSASQY